MGKILKPLLLISLVALLIGCGWEALQLFSTKKHLWVVWGPNVPMDIQKVHEVSGGEFQGKIKRKLKYSNGFVAEMTTIEAEYLQQTYGVKLEKDVKHFLDIRGCGSDPPDVPDRPHPPQEIPWGIHAVNAPAAWQITRGKGSVICVADTGVEDGHYDLKGQVKSGEDLTDTGYWQDDQGHGTHVAGTIAALDNSIGVVGVCPECNLVVAKVLNKWGWGYSSWIAEGIRSCIAQGANVVSMSLGSNSPSQVIHDAVKAAHQAGLIVVSAAGNDGGPVGWPAAFPESLAISASDIQNRIAGFSNFGPEIDFIAPGVDVLSTLKGNKYDRYNGTSMATPHVSGVAGLAISVGRRVLRARSINLPREHEGQGLIDAYETVR